MAETAVTNPVEPTRLAQRTKSDLTEKIELQEHRLKLRAESEAQEEGMFGEGQHDGMLVAVASTQAWRTASLSPAL